MAEYRVRPATPQDAAAIALIYNQRIEDRLATLETELRTPEERRQWLSARSPRHPVIVADMTEPKTTEPKTTSNRPPTSQSGLAGPATRVPATAATGPAIAGWGSLNPFSARAAYGFVADFSVYVERGWRGKGVGRVLLARLIELGREHGYHKLVLSAFPFNKPGVALYEKLGFRTVGVYHEQGMLDGQWVDTIIMEKLL
jgi:L-amino acid N-acyltransferase YncA